ncbi:MAG TPA: tRNA (N(6)-L-threonylcarbamoyladenosine(37)-C(2))-methylthiotransferase MtaB [Saprospiraceae bacterium]|jgi:threonylcarbamoyladenosine tRNA methylthiotransferase MtaB|nr:tRNA (N(6)-L-threonylcarbamoyladenosine(37)-C(2))-methylthiotransferase MtaB [Saprospiraceae bacterium]HRO09507.1 tRNA (N(6)-L-threonylcarbamoyladenosine(37)-C(2))-methylthiotransferase MtaB [Saprospiraceae bacterium]HRO73279.1 tRNA (N(6)-L-threonylcarbamoyladenosine(37)-C(2))-methylthiotransferase MtaB [Saprospiraceae bacterium]HRP42796.1 tRNA (N(6)-L-threonylcarbamoyladenosine(37)-C(2))-methylthiotransferase MtaB [Saprospiraceae bacterium]
MATPLTVAYHTLGCKLNFSETSSIRRNFEDHGYTTVDFEDGADIYILNTCSVTEFADKKCRYEVRRALKYAPQAKIIVIGCYAQLKPVEISEIPGVDLVLGAAEKFNILNYIEGISKSSDKGMVIAGDVKQANSFIDAFSFGDRTRSFLKVQDGCDYKCTFCTIPQARGNSRSDTIDNVLENVNKIAAEGVREIVLTGVNLGDFGNGTEVIEGSKPKKEALFFDLIKELDKTDGIRRFRISSIEPNLLTEEIIDFVAESQKFVPHFHIPLQSGSDRILKNMRRRYLSQLYRERVDWIKSRMPHCCIGVDVIVGFPGESDADFLETYNFLNQLDISYLHVFTYSERANTPATEMGDKVPTEVRRQRNEMLRILSHKKRLAFTQPFLGTVRPVLFEHTSNPDMMSGYTDNYIKVMLPKKEELINTIGNVRLLHWEDSHEYVAGELVNLPKPAHV